MDNQTEKMRVVFATVLRHIPNRRESIYEGINTSAFLTNLAYSWPLPLDVDQKRGLTAICRSLSVSNQVRSNYNRNWTRASRDEPLESIYWPVMIAVLSAQFQEKTSNGDESKGEQLKRLNAAFTAIDIAEELDDIPNLLELRQHLKGLLNGIVNR